MGKNVAKTQTGEPCGEREEPCLKLDWWNDTLAIVVSGDHGRIYEAAGHSAVADGVFQHLTLLGSPGIVPDESATNFALGYIDAMQPEDPAEVLLCAQMAAMHQANMTMAGRLNQAQSNQERDLIERGLNKLSRTFLAQMDTLKRYRSKGQQVVRVERVNVSEGGQAIVGDVRTGGGQNEKK